MNGNRIEDSITPEFILRKLEAALVEDNIRENHLRWFGHVEQRPIRAPLKRNRYMVVRGLFWIRGTPSLTWI